MKAKMKKDLVSLYIQVMPDCIDDEIEAFLRSIEGKEVDLRLINGDAFEVNDDNIWLPNELWDAL